MDGSGVAGLECLLCEGLDVAALMSVGFPDGIGDELRQGPGVCLYPGVDEQCGRCAPKLQTANGVIFFV